MVNHYEHHQQEQHNQEHHHHVYKLCKDHMHSYVLAETKDGSKVDGIITGLDDEFVYLAIPLGDEGHEPHHPHMMPRQFGYYGYPGFYPGFRPRFRRLVLPLAALTAISLLPWY